MLSFEWPVEDVQVLVGKPLAAGRGDVVGLSLGVWG